VVIRPTLLSLFVLLQCWSLRACWFRADSGCFPYFHRAFFLAKRSGVIFSFYQTTLLSLPRFGQALFVFAIMVFLLLLLGLACLRTYPDNRELLDVFSRCYSGWCPTAKEGPTTRWLTSLHSQTNGPSIVFMFMYPIRPSTPEKVTKSFEPHPPSVNKQSRFILRPSLTVDTGSKACHNSNAQNRFSCKINDARSGAPNALVAHKLRAARSTLLASLHSKGKFMKNLLLRLWKDQEGQDLTEYALLLVLLSLAAVGSLGLLANAINNVFSKAVGNLTT